MAIPAFEPDGLLPAAVPFMVDDDDGPILSGHECTLAEAKERMVTAFPASLTRPVLWEQLERLLHQAQEHLECLLLVVSGAFVTFLDNPRDIFVVLDVPGEDIEKLDGEAQWLLARLFDSQEWELGADDALRIQTGLVRAYPPGHIKFDMGNAERTVQRFLACSPVQGAENAGYLEILECEGGLNHVNEIFAPPAPGDPSP